MRAFRRSRWLFILILILATISAEAQTPLRVIPSPREWTSAAGFFVPDRNTLILLVAPNAEDKFAAEELATEIERWCGLRPAIKELREIARVINAIVLGRAGFPGMAALLKSRGFVDQLAITETFHEEGYVVDVDTSGMMIGARTSAGLFYGVQTAMQMLQPQDNRWGFAAGRVRDWPVMRWRGISDDLSRGPIPTLDTMKKQVRTLAAFKLNQLSLYMEHVFSYSEHPLFAPEGAALDARQIAELVEFGKKYHVEIIPEQQAFGHLHHVLKYEKYSDLGEIPHGHVLAPVQPASYQFIEELFKELVPLFPSRFLHIGGDETFELGTGQSKQHAEEVGLGTVYLNHLIRVAEMLRPYGRRLMFWGDIALRYPDLLSRIPKDLIAMTWAYGPRDNFDSMIVPFRGAGLEVFVCPGVSGWNQIFPNISAATTNIRNFVRDGQKHGAIGMMNTTWDDDGESFFEVNWYGIGWGAACAWQEGESRPEAYRQAFDWMYLKREGETIAQTIELLGSIHQILDARQATDTLFWEDPFTPEGLVKNQRLLAKAREVRLTAERALEALLKEGAKSRRNAQLVDYMKFAARRFDYLGKKMQMVEDLRAKYNEAYRNMGNAVLVRGNLSRFTNLIHPEFQELRDDLVLLRNHYRELWLKENRPYWLDNIVVRYDAMIFRWEDKLRQLRNLQAGYSATGLLPPPAELGLEMPGR